MQALVDLFQANPGAWTFSEYWAIYDLTQRDEEGHRIYPTPAVVSVRFMAEEINVYVNPPLRDLYDYVKSDSTNGNAVILTDEEKTLIRTVIGPHHAAAQAAVREQRQREEQEREDDKLVQDSIARGLLNDLAMP